MDVPDTIERSITITAAIEAMWDLVSEPGWWINDGELAEHDIRQQAGRTVVIDSKLGEFPLIVVAERKPEYVAFRWAPWDGHQQAEEGTLVEFFLTDRGDGSIMVTVVESGFASLALSPERVRENQIENVAGWQLEMGLLAAAFDS